MFYLYSFDNFNLFEAIVPIVVVFFGIACVIPISTSQALSPYGHMAGIASAELGFFQMGLAMVMFIHGSKHLPAAELTLLTMLEVILSPIWVWLLFNEHPGNWTLIGGSIIILGVMVQAIGARRRHPQPQIF